MRETRIAVILLWGSLICGLTIVGCYQPTALVDEGVEEGPAASVSTQVPLADEDDDAEDEDEVEVEIPLDQVPNSIKQAALDAVPGLVIEEAIQETENGVMVYELEGTANGQEYEVEISTAGEVLEIEQEDDEEEDADD